MLALPSAAGCYGDVCSAGNGGPSPERLGEAGETGVVEGGAWAGEELGDGELLRVCLYCPQSHGGVAFRFVRGREMARQDRALPTKKSALMGEVTVEGRR